MKKRAMSLLLVLLMVISLIPAFALNAAAMDANAQLVSEEESAEGSNPVMSKKLFLNPDGTYSIQLEAYATGTTTSTETETITPTDIVLVLDQSGSMKFAMTLKYSYEELYARRDADGKTPFYASTEDDYSLGGTVPNTSYPVYVRKEANGTYTAYYYSRNIWGDTKEQRIPADTNGKVTVYLSRLDALKTAVSKFVDSVAAKKDKDGNAIDNKIAIVGFSSTNNSYNNTEIFSGSSSKQYADVKKDISTNYADYALKAPSDTALKNTVEALSANGGTGAYMGLELANRVLSDRTNTEGRNAAVVLFTDGRPGNIGGDDRSEEDHANLAIAEAQKLKATTGTKPIKATVFSVGVFDEKDSNKLDNGSSKYSIKDYMETVSSMYPTASSLDNRGTKNAKDYKFYQKTGGEGDTSLDDLFEVIAQTIDDASTSVTLTEQAVLSDEIAALNFTLPANATVTAQTFKGVQSEKNGAISWDTTTDAAYSAELSTQHVGDKVTVTGFDYAGNFVAFGKEAKSNLGLAANQGRKLVVTIDGLVPNKEGNLDSNGVCGIFENATAADPAVSVGSPAASIGHRTYVIDFNARMKIAENAILTDLNATQAVGTNGVFKKDGSTVSYQLMPDITVSDGENLTLSSADSAMVYGNFYSTARADASKNEVETGAKQWLQVNAVPADNVYFDDSLKDNTVIVGDGSGYNAGVQFEEASAQVPGKYSFTFNGTGVDVYCTTNDKAGTIVAKLLDKDGNVVDQSRKNMYNHSETERYNIPTISYRDLEAGQYKVVLTVLDGIEYNLDGVRVYNPAAGSDTQFLNLRDALVNDASKAAESVTITNEEAKKGLLFVDDENGLELEQVEYKTDENGNRVPVLDENGNPKTTKVYNDTFEAYKAVSPKNEIYLAPGESLMFQLKDGVAVDNALWIGLSAPDKDAGSGKVTIGKEVAVTSGVDMYYPITADMIGDKGVVTIENTGKTMISVTDLKAAGLSAGGADSLIDQIFAPITEQTLKIAANGGVDPDQVKDAWNANAWNPKQVLNALFQLLMQSLSGLFNGLGNW